jgi:hypothetical protein
MRLVGYDQIETRHVAGRQRFRDLRGRLVGREYDTRTGPAKKRRDLLGVCGDGEAEILRVGDGGIGFSDCLVRAHRKGLEIHRLVGRPLTHRLTKKR